MQYTGHIPLYYQERGKNSHGFTRYIFDANANCRDYRGCDISAHQSLKTQTQYLGYDKETMRQIIQNQDKTFRYQVQELHRLYRRQRELMDDIKMREIYMRDLQLQTSKSVFQCLSQASHNDTRQFLGCGSVSNIFVLSEEKTSTASITGKFEEKHRSSHIGLLNSNDSELGSVKTGDSSPCDLLSEKKLKFFIDLNEPLKTESFMSNSTESSCLMETTHHDQHMGCGFDLNTVPLDFPSESEVRHENLIVSEDSEEKLYQQREGLSSSEDTVNKKNTGHRAVFVDGISNHDCSFSKATNCVDMNTNVEKELEGPLSPNNKGSSCMGEPIQELDRIAAETLIAIFSSARYDMHLTDVITDEVLENSLNSLYWFADNVSSVGDDDDLEIKLHDQSKLVSSEMTEDNTRTKIVKRKSLCLSSAARKGTPSGSTRSHKSKRSAARDMNHPKGFKKNERTSLSSPSDDTRMLKVSREKVATRRNSSANERKHATNFSGSYNVRKSESSALKGHDIRSKQCVLHDWGKIKKRRGGFRGSKFQAIDVLD